MSATLFGKYELISKLASGGMAVTYKALMLGAMGVKKPVVLKLIHPHLAEEAEFVDMFIEEAKLSATLTHSNIAQVFDFGEVDGRYFIAMELVDGQSLSHVLKRAKRKGYPVLPVPLAMLITVEMCEALYYAHTRTDEQGALLNLVHRDVSPENVLISWNGEVKLVDFGIAKSTMTGKQTATGMVKGKYPYFSPEQSRADRTMDARTDVYAATVVLYEMLCARRPYEGEFVEVMRALLTGDYPLPSSLNPEVPPELEQLILKGLALDRAARFRTSREMGQAINTLAHALYPDVHRSDLHSLMSVMFEEDLKASGRTVEIRAGFREEVLDARSGDLATDAAADSTPAQGLPRPTDEQLATGKKKVPTSGRHALHPQPSAPRPASERRKVASGTVKSTGMAPTMVPDTRIEPGHPGEEPDDTGDDDAPAPLPPGVRMTGPQKTELSLDSPEKAIARAKAVKLMAGVAGGVFLLVAVLAIVFSGPKKEKDSFMERTPVWATSVPNGAEVSVDGKPMGKAPMDGVLPAGTYTFAMTMDGYRPWTKRMSIGGSRQVHVEGKLIPEGKDQPVEIKRPEMPTQADGPLTEIADGGVVLDRDMKHSYHFPLRAFTMWPAAHTLAIGQYRTFSYDLEPETTYAVSLSGSIDLGHAGRTSALMYYLEGEKIDPKERFGFITTNATKTFHNVSRLYTWVFDDDPSDNKGKMQFTFRISKYIPERYATFNVEDHVVVPADTDFMQLDGLLPDHTYSLVFRPDSPKVLGAVPSHVFCIQQTAKPKPIQKKYVWYPIKFVGNVTGVTGLQCMFLSFEGTGTSGLLEVDIDDLAELRKR